MCIKYSCFISYAHPRQGGDNLRPFIEQLKKTLEKWLGLYLDDETVYLDTKRLMPGFSFNEKIAEAICQSACMIVVFTGLYQRHTYCLREFLAMEYLEEERKQILGQKYDRNRRMIIPIIIKLMPNRELEQQEEEQLPAKIKEIQYCDFSRFYLAGTRAMKREYDQEIVNIAKQILTHFQNLKTLDNNGGLDVDCARFLLPSEDDAKQSWGMRSTEPDPFVMRSTQ